MRLNVSFLSSRREGAHGGSRWRPEHWDCGDRLSIISKCWVLWVEARFPPRSRGSGESIGGLTRSDPLWFKVSHASPGLTFLICNKLGATALPPGCSEDQMH